MKINNRKIVDRWDAVMNCIGCEHIMIDDRLSELEDHKAYYEIEDGISISWMLYEAQYWLSCYYEPGHVRCDDRFLDEDNYKIWLSETGKLKRLIVKLKKMRDTEDSMIVEW